MLEGRRLLSLHDRCPCLGRSPVSQTQRTPDSGNPPPYCVPCGFSQLSSPSFSLSVPGLVPLTAMPQQPDPAIVQDFQRKFTGLDDKLKFQPGHTICNKYDAYKTAAESAKCASTTYKTTAAGLKATKPYAEPAYNTGGTAYHSSGHRILEPLAGNASTTAEL